MNTILDNVKGDDVFYIQPGEDAVVITFDGYPKTNVRAKRGYIHYGLTISGVDYVIYDEDDNDRTLWLKSAEPTITDGRYINVELKYPSQQTDERHTYKITFTLSMSDGSTRCPDAKRVIARDF